MAPDIVSPLSVIREAIRAVPAVKWSLAVGGVLSTIALLYTFGIDPRLAFVGLIIMFVFMGVMVVFARASTLRGGMVAMPAFVFTWFALVMFMATSIILFTSVFFAQPVDLQDWITGRRQTEVAIPIIADADSGWVDGGSSPKKFCDPQLKAIQAKYPSFVVAMQILPEQHKSERTPFKHDFYRYTCSFSAAMK